MQAAIPAAASAQQKPTKKVHYKDGKKPERKPGTPPPMFNGAVSYGNLLFIAGKGAHYKGDIKEHTKTVLDEVEKELINAGSSMDKVLKCNVYLADMRYFQAMNDVFSRFFPTDPPARTTVEAALAEPEMLVEIEAIAYIE